ncbi:MAG: c-type cytochrome biogenesis protein CcmI [Stenotrophobium sp.]
MMAYGGMALLTVLALLLLSRPWWSRGQERRMARRAANVAAYRLRLAEIDADIAAGIINPDAAEVLRREQAARLMTDADDHADDRAAAPRQTSQRFLLVLLLIALPVLAALWYFDADSWRMQRDIAESAAHPARAQALMIESMVRRLEKRLDDHPDDAEGWAMLGRSYFVMQRYADAARAYTKANALNGQQNAGGLVDEGEALAMAHNRDLSGEPARLFDAALAIDSANGKGLWYAGLAAAQSDNYAKAQADWLRLRGQDLPPDMSEALEARLKELSQLSGVPVPPKAAVASAQAKPSAGTAPGVTLHVLVSIAPALAASVPDDATLFVFAKAAGGPPMPLAVQRFQGGAWSLKQTMQVTLDDSMAMMPQLRLSLFKNWVVSARISRHGTVQPEAGDMEGQVALDQSAAAAPVRIEISKRVQ